jgi:hypothetical protein
MKNLTVTEAIQVTGHLLEHHSTTGNYARNRYGHPVSPYSLNASCFCYIGAQRLMEDYLVSPAETVGLYVYECDKAAGIKFAGEWDDADPNERLAIARRLQNY